MAEQIVRNVPFVGRQAVLAEIARLVEEGTSPIVIRGAAGEGKTRLLRELGSWFESRATRVVYYNFYPTTPPSPASSLLFSLARALPSLEKWIEDQPSPTDGLARATDAPEGLLSDAVSQHFLASNRPIALLVDSVQWASSGALGFLAELVARHLPGLTVVLSLRSEEPGNRNSVLSALLRNSHRIDLGPLDFEATSELVMAICGPLRDVELKQFYERTNGNPLVVREIAAYLSRTNSIETMPLQDVAAWSALPQDVYGLTTFAGDEEEEGDIAQILDAAACLRSPFSAALLAGITALDVDVVENAVQEVSRRGIVQPLPYDPESFEFVSQIAHEARYNALKPSEKRRLHSAIADLPPHTLSFDEAAYHKAKGYSGIRRSEAVESCLAAAEKAERVYAFESAVHFYRLGLSCVATANPAERGRIQLKMGLAQRASGDWYGAVNSLDKAVRNLAEGGLTEDAAEAAYELAEIYRFRFKLNEASAWLRRALSLSPRPNLRLKALSLLSGTRAAMDDLPAASELLEEALVLSEEVNVVPPELALWGSFSLSQRHDRESARALAQRGLRQAIEDKDHANTALLAGQMILSELSLLNLEEARNYARLFTAIEEPHNLAALVRMLYARCMIHAYRGEWRACYETSLRWVREVRLAGPFQIATAQVLAAEAASALGLADDAIRLANEALPRLETQRPVVSLHLAKYAWRQGRTEEAKELVRSVLKDIMTVKRYSSGRAILGDLAFALDDRQILEELFSALSQEKASMMVVYSPLSVSRITAKLAFRLELWPQAFAYYEKAVSELTQGQALGELYYTYSEYAEARKARSKRGDATKAASLRAAAQNVLREIDLAVPAIVSENLDRYGLTAREVGILGFIARGYRNREIATELGLSINTVERHVENITRKMGASNRTDAAAMATAAGLLSH